MKLTKDELKQIYYINKEIQMWQRELEKIRSQGLVKSPTISDMPKGGQKLIEYIEGVDDSLMKQIIFYRCVSCMTWQEVADAVGGNNTENSVKKAYSRFLAEK